MSDKLQTALKLCEANYCIIPVSKDKKPLIAWTEYQTRKSTPEEIKEWFKKFKNPNIGIVTGQISNLLVVDCDSQEAIEQIESMLPDNIVLPVSATPRGGRHYYFAHTDGIPNKAGILSKIDVRSLGGYIVTCPSISSNGKAYTWESESTLLDTVPPVLPVNLLNAFKANIKDSIHYIEGGFVKGGGNNITGSGTKLFQQGNRDQDLFHVANCLIKGGANQAEASQVLNILSENCNPPFPKKEIKIKIESALKRVQSRERNISAEVREWIMTTTGHTTTTNCHNELGMTTKDHKKAANMTLVRLVQEGVIEKYGDKNGCYRYIEPDEDTEMEFIEGDFYEYPVRLPFGLNDICEIYAQNIIIVAGCKGAGKTSFLLNIALANCQERDVVYLNSEMGAKEWTKRLNKFDIYKKKDIKFKAKPCHHNFHDKIKPADKIYIIDYLEIHDNFYEVAKHIRLIHEKLKDGICVIALQKKTNERLGRGAEFSMEKSRLYLTLDYLEDQFCSKLTIVDAKNLRTAMNFNGMSKRIKILNGSKMEAIDKEWRRQP